jgi:DNA-binding transcriptional LysR family regulator
VSVTPLATEINYLYCARGHEAFDLPDKEISLEDVSRYRMVRHGYSESESKAIRRWNLSAESTSHQTEGIMLLVLTGSFVGFLPDHFAKRWEEDGRIRRILPDKLKNATEIIAITHKASQANPVVRQFLSFFSAGQEEPDTFAARPINEEAPRSFGG